MPFNPPLTRAVSAGMNVVDAYGTTHSSTDDPEDCSEDTLRTSTCSGSSTKPLTNSDASSACIDELDRTSEPAVGRDRVATMRAAQPAQPGGEGRGRGRGEREREDWGDRDKRG